MADLFPPPDDPEVFEVTNAGTRYRVHRLDAATGSTFYLVESGWGHNYGEWIRLGMTSVAWSYLAEKMPIMAQREGDKPGWIMAFDKAGLRVFN